MKRALIISGVVAAAIGVTAVAVQAKSFGKGFGPRGPMPMEFSQLDINGDGQMTKEEMQAFGEQRFAEADTDGDGFLSMEEMKAHMVKEIEARFDKHGDKMLERKDANGDGKLSLEEMRPNEKRQDKMFARMDADSDGVITQEEFDAARSKMAERRQGKKDKSKAPVEN
ncbi:EF-hand domain-containing protein [uncultured Shimia sp.]|uniref:EF-hand domain-containing protein n=1 Tax=uncultured Shimia sp. TaxID=573152 RepID=UPI00260D0F36|nr:EF-hand domain-containing protein [uncultured Shimia sp.]